MRSLASKEFGSLLSIRSVAGLLVCFFFDCQQDIHFPREDTKVKAIFDIAGLCVVQSLLAAYSPKDAKDFVHSDGGVYM